MAVTKITYAADAPIVAANWESLVAGGWATLPEVSNLSTLFMDVSIGGQINLDTATGALAAGESFDIYISAQFKSDVASSYSGGIDTAFNDDDSSLTEDTEFNPLNLILLTSVAVEATTPDIEQGYNWFVGSIAQAFGGVMPRRWMLVGHNNTGGTTKATTSTTIINYNGITYTTA